MGVEITLVTFQGFEHDAKTLLARHVEVDSKSAKPPPGPSAMFEKRAQAPKIQKLLEIVTAMFMSQHDELWQSHSSSRRHFSRDYLRHAMPEESKLKPRATLFIELDTGIDGVKERQRVTPFLEHRTETAKDRLQPLALPSAIRQVQIAPTSCSRRTSIKLGSGDRE